MQQDKRKKQQQKKLFFQSHVFHQLAEKRWLK